jgi:hypothetical protein
MWQTLFSLCLALSRPALRRRSPRRPAFRRPLLEPLEDRTVLSPYVVTTTAASRAGSLAAAVDAINADTSLQYAPATPNRPDGTTVDEIDFDLPWNDSHHFYYQGSMGNAQLVPTMAIDGIRHITSDAQLLDPGVVGTANTAAPQWSYSWWDIQSGGLSFNKAVVIDGYTQTGANQNTWAYRSGNNAILKIDLDGGGSGYDGISLTDNSTVTGLAINRFNDYGVRIFGSNDLIVGNFVGTDVSGTLAEGNGALGAAGVATGNGTIEGNVISGNLGRGILANGSCVIDNNLIGTDPTGTVGLGNGVGGTGIRVEAPATVTGNVISGDITNFGIQIAEGSGSVVQGNLIGTDVTGTRTLGNYVGIAAAVPCLIGGTCAADRNVISGNDYVGIIVDGPGGAVIQGNYVGTDITGTQALNPYRQNGISCADGGGNTSATIGGTDPGEGNLISGNDNGILLQANDCVIQGNLIGTDYTGTQRLTNAGGLGNSVGIALTFNSSNNTIGGASAGAANVIAASGQFGINCANYHQPPGTGNLIQGNFIGTNATLSSTLGNRYSGINFETIWLDNTVAANVIAFNQGFGVSEHSDPTGGSGDAGAVVGTSILGNSIFGNAAGIDSSDAAPVLTTVYAATEATIVLGTMAGTSGTKYHLEFFANTADDAEGRTFLGSACADGNSSFIATLSAALPAGQTLVTATATDPDGNTSRFSAGVTATPLPPSSLSGVVWEDFNNDGQVDFGENGISGVTITLTGTDFLGNAVNVPPQTTDSDGAYVFANLYPGNYSLTETQPAGYGQGINSIGTAGGNPSGTDQFCVALGVGVNGLNYNYGERPPASGGVQHGQTAGLGFWNNKNGQALIKSLPVVTNADGSVTSVANWLATTLPKTFGKYAANNLTGQSNAAVAALFQQDFVMKGVKLDAQVLATALSVYVTNATLDSTKVAASYGFTVSGDGAGTATVNVGSNGGAFGVANSSTLTLMDLLLATDAQAVNGVLYGGNATRRNEANNVYSAVNQAGNIN